MEAAFNSLYTSVLLVGSRPMGCVIILLAGEK